MEMEGHLLSTLYSKEMVGDSVRAVKILMKGEGGFIFLIELAQCLYKIKLWQVGLYFHLSQDNLT